MIQSLLLEPYRYPAPVTISVTILRGPRRMRFSRQLRKYYQDFAPKLWFIMQKLGYKKFLQRLYIDIDTDIAITHNYYELPILLAVLAEIKLLNLPDLLFTLGKITAQHTVILEQLIETNAGNFSSNTFFAPSNKARLLDVLNQLNSFTVLPQKLPTLFSSDKCVIVPDVQKLPAFNLNPLLRYLLPNLLFYKDYLLLEHAPLATLQKFDKKMLQSLRFLWSESTSLPSKALQYWLLQNHENVNLTIVASQAQKKEREELLLPLFSNDLSQNA